MSDPVDGLPAYGDLAHGDPLPGDPAGGEEWIYDEAERAAIDAWRPAETRRGDAGVAGLRRSTSSGALAAAIMLGLREVLEPPPDDEQAVVVDAPGEPEDPTAPLVLRFDPESPGDTVAIVRAAPRHG